MLGKMRLPKFQSRALKYGYSNARVRGMKGLLLNSNALNELIKVGTIEGMAELLQRTGYKNELASSSVAFSGSELIEAASASNFARAVQKLIKITPKDDAAPLQALLLKWELMNLKTLMHARKLSRSYDEVKAQLFPVGGLSEDDFKILLKADDKDLLSELRRTGLWTLLSSRQKMRGAMESAMKNADAFFRMESAIDGGAYLIMDSALASHGSEVSRIRKIMKREIDAKNVLIIERLKKRMDRGRVMKSLIPGGTMNESMIGMIMDSRDMAGLASVIKTKFPGISVKDDKLTNLEIALERSIAAQKVSAFHSAILSVGVIIGFMLLKEEEVNNLRKIAKGKEFNMTEGEVREMLVVV